MKSVIVAIAVIGLLLADPVVRTAAASDGPTAEEYSVYASLLAARWGGAGRSSFVIQRETTDAAHTRDYDRVARFLREEFKVEEPSVSLDEALVASFGRVRESRVNLNAELLRTPNAIVTSSREIDAIFRNDGPLVDRWTAFRKQFDGAWGIVRLSRVAFSADGIQALLSISGSCGPLCGSGEYLWLRKTDGKWRIVASARAWVS